MMILTMPASDGPTNSHNHSHQASGTIKACTPTSNGEVSSSSSDSSSDSSSGSSSGSSSSYTSLSSICSSSNSTSSSGISTSSTTLKAKKRVSFGLQQTAYFSRLPDQVLSQQERKNECWYSEAELNASRDEARMAIQALHHQLQLDATAAAATTHTVNGTTTRTTTTTATPVSDEYGSWVLRCPQDETKIVCLRGIEKYADAAAKYAGQKRLVRSVLQQQILNNKDIHISLVSRTLSEPFKEVARYYAMKSSQELDLSRRHEEQQEMEQKQREEVATVLLLIMGQQQNNQKQQQQHQQHHLQQQQLPRTPSSNSSSKLQEASPIVTPRRSISNKRSSFTSSPLSSESRNVKPCIRAISDRMRGL